MIFLKYTPKKNKKGRIVSLICMLLGGMGLVFSVTADMSYSLLVQMLSLFLFVISFEFFYRYEMTTFTYILDEKNFVVIKEVGKKKTCVCNLAMSTALAVLETPKKSAERKSMEAEYGRIGIRYNHAQVMRPKHPYSVLFSFNDKIAEIVFEPSDMMVMMLKSRIAENEADA